MEITKRSHTNMAAFYFGLRHKFFIPTPHGKGGCGEGSSSGIVALSKGEGGVGVLLRLENILPSLKFLKLKI